MKDDDLKTELFINEIVTHLTEKRIDLLIEKGFDYEYKDISVNWESIDKSVSPSAGIYF